MSLLKELLEGVKLGDRPGFEHLKHRVNQADMNADQQAAQRRYMHLQASDKLSQEEREELDAMAHGKTKVESDPDKKLEYKLHQAKKQRDHHQAHIDRANAKLQDPNTSDYIKKMIRYLTLPEQTKFLDSVNIRIDKYNKELNNLQGTNL